MKVEKLSISLDPRLSQEVRAAAERAGLSVSAWLAASASAALRRQALTELLADWESKHGAITADELAKAREELGYTRGRRKRSA